VFNTLVVNLPSNNGLWTTEGLQNPFKTRSVVVADHDVYFEVVFKNGNEQKS